MRHRWWRRHRGVLASAAGGAAAVAGIALLIAPAPTAVYLDGSGIRVGAMTLTPLGLGERGVLRYGGEASYALSEPGDSTAGAAAAWVEGGVIHTASCELQTYPLRLVDDCTFGSGAGELTSVDILDAAQGSSWTRTYSDGVRVIIDVAQGAAVPIPFPLGR